MAAAMVTGDMKRKNTVWHLPSLDQRRSSTPCALSSRRNSDTASSLGGGSAYVVGNGDADDKSDAGSLFSDGKGSSSCRNKGQAACSSN